MRFCAERFLEEKNGCRMKWSKPSVDLPVCSGEQIAFYANSSISLSSMGDLRFQRTTGCLRKCTRFAYDLRESTTSSTTDLDNGNVTMIVLALPEDGFEVREEVFLYPFCSYFGDTGGTMGLLLGFSLLSAFNGAQDFVGKRMGKSI